MTTIDYLSQQASKSVLRFLTCGSVDDGKSTLIGRLLYDCQQVYEDQLAEISQEALPANDEQTEPEIDLAYLLDGLQAEREQGITIDVAYRYFSTDKRQFIIADTPGHEQYTRNMVTGASNCDLSVIIVDASRGIQAQTRRHTYLCHLLGIRHLIVAVNKMDLVDYRHTVFHKIKEDYRQMVADLSIADLRFVPMSAKHGDNVVYPSQSMDWYPGATLLKLLETVKIAQDKSFAPLRFPVQYVNRPHSDFRGYCGTLASGCLTVGDSVKVLPSGTTTAIQAIYVGEQSLSQAYPGQAVTITVTDERDISRGDLLVQAKDNVVVGQQFYAQLFCFSPTPLRVHKRYLLQFAGKTTTAQLIAIADKTDEQLLTAKTGDFTTLLINEVGKVLIECVEPIVIDCYQQLPATGAFIVIDPLSYQTVGAGLVSAPRLERQAQRQYSAAEIALNQFIREHYPEWNCLEINS